MIEGIAWTSIGAAPFFPARFRRTPLWRAPFWRAWSWRAWFWPFSGGRSSPFKTDILLPLLSAAPLRR